MNLFVGDKKYRTWSKEGPLWWLLYRTEVPGSFNDKDAIEFNDCKVKYLIFLDHKDDTKARELAMYLLDRFDHFKAAKVSKFARDGEKCLVLVANDNSLQTQLADFVKSWGMLLLGAKPKNFVSDYEKDANATWGDYITKLAKAFKPKP